MKEAIEDADARWCMTSAIFRRWDRLNRSLLGLTGTGTGNDQMFGAIASHGVGNRAACRWHFGALVATANCS
jgi:hypothetical protein